MTVTAIFSIATGINFLPAAAVTVTDVSLGRAANYTLVSGGFITLGASATFGGSESCTGASSPGSADGTTIAALNLAGLTSFDNDNDAAKGAISDIKAAISVIDSLTAVNIFGTSASHPPGVYITADDAALDLTTSFILDGGGNYDSIFIFRIFAAITVAADLDITFINGAQPAHIFWVSKAAINIGARTKIPGNFIAGAAITTGESSTIYGSILGLAEVTTGASAQVIHNTTLPSPTDTETVTSSPSPTDTETVTASPSPADTETVTASPSPTDTETVTASPEPTAPAYVAPASSPSPAPIYRRDPIKKPVVPIVIPKVPCENVISDLRYLSLGKGTSAGFLSWAVTGNGVVQYFGDTFLYPYLLKYGEFTSTWIGHLVNIIPGVNYVVSVNYLADCGRISGVSTSIFNEKISDLNTLTIAPSETKTPSSTTPVLIGIPNKLKTQSPIPSSPKSISSQKTLATKEAIAQFATVTMFSVRNGASLEKTTVRVVVRNLSKGQNISITLKSVENVP